MRPEIAGQVFNVFRKGLELRERVQNNSERLDFFTEQGQLKEAIRKVSDVGREGGEGTDRFLGLRYPLTCWLDEIFILESPWGESPWSEQWKDANIELAFNNTRDRSWLFWEQARLAESRVGAEALEVIFLCVQLGFRGEKRNDPGWLRDWCHSTRALIFQDQRVRMPMPDERPCPTYVPPLLGQRQWQTMMQMGVISALILIPFSIFYFLIMFSGQ